jgi:hypothetical protein
MDDAAPTIEEVRDTPRSVSGLWARRLFLLVPAVLAIAALLNLFGQRQAVSHAKRPAATLTVSSPSRLRGGLLYQARVHVTARQAIKQPELVFDRGWFDQTTVNAIDPEPSQEQPEDGGVGMQFDPLPPGGELTLWVAFQANPTNIGRHRTNVVLKDGDSDLASVHRTQLNLP